MVHTEFGGKKSSTFQGLFEDQKGMVPIWVFQLMPHELWQEHQNYMKTHFHDH